MSQQFSRILLIAGVIVLLAFGVTDLRKRLEANLLAANANASAAILELLTVRLSTTDDVNRLLRLGHHLLKQNQSEPASLVFARVAELAPTSRDAHLYLGWSLMRQLEISDLTADRIETTFGRARTAIMTARRLDPLDPAAKTLGEQVETAARPTAEAQ